MIASTSYNFYITHTLELGDELMKVIMYGSEICPDCVAAKKQLLALPEIELEYRNITENTTNLKEFLAFRDHEEMFASIKANGKIGIPFFILPDGSKIFTVSDFAEVKEINTDTKCCSLSGEKQC